MDILSDASRDDHNTDAPDDKSMLAAVREAIAEAADRVSAAGLSATRDSLVADIEVENLAWLRARLGLDDAAIQYRKPARPQAWRGYIPRRPVRQDGNSVDKTPCGGEPRPRWHSHWKRLLNQSQCELRRDIG